MKKYIKYKKRLNIIDLAHLLKVEYDDILKNSDFLEFKIDEDKKLSFKKAKEIAKIYDAILYRDRSFIFLLIINIVAFGLITCATTYSIITFFNSKNNNADDNPEIQTGIFKIEFNEDINSKIELTDSYPMSDEKAKSLAPFIFTVSNKGTIDALYRLKLFDYSNSYIDEYNGYGKLSLYNIKYSIICKENPDLNKSGLLSDLVKYKYDGSLDQDKSFIVVNSILYKNTSKNFELRLWIDSTSTNEAADKYYVGKIVLESDRR